MAEKYRLSRERWTESATWYYYALFHVCDCRVRLYRGRISSIDGIYI